MHGAEGTAGGTACSVVSSVDFEKIESRVADIRPIVCEFLTLKYLVPSYLETAIASRNTLVVICVSLRCALREFCCLKVTLTEHGR